jgi:hypothetical protein
VGRRLRARPQDGLQSGGVVASTVVNAAVSAPESSPGPVSGIGVDPVLGETELVSPAATDELALGGHLSGPAGNRQAVASHNSGLLPRGDLVGREARMAKGRDKRAAAIVQQLKATLTLEFRLLIVSSGAFLSSASSMATIGMRLGSMRS